MIIDIWSDMVCPFCYIGKRRLENALARFDDKDGVELRYRSFQLDPDARSNTGKNIHAVLAEKYKLSYDQARRMNHSLERQAKDEGLNYHMDGVIPAGTLDAHRLSHWAAEHNLQVELEERLMKAYFVDSLNIADRDTLARLAGEVGLDEKAALEVLSSDRYGEEVEQDQLEAEKLGIRGVPHFIINGRYQVSGAQPAEVFLEAMNKAKAAG